MDLLFPYCIPELYHFRWLVTSELADNSHYNSSPSLSEKVKDSFSGYQNVQIYNKYMLHITCNSESSLPTLSSSSSDSTNYIWCRPNSLT